MSGNRLSDYLRHIQQASAEAMAFVEEMAKEEFLRDRRTQQAVMMSLIVIGEAATRILDSYPAFAEKNQAVPWRSMRGMRNRMAHGYFDVDLEMVWETVCSSLPGLQRALAALEDAGS